MKKNIPTIIHDKRELFRCDCHDLAHIFEVSYDETKFHGSESVLKELSVSVLIEPKSFTRRIKDAFKIFIGKKFVYEAEILLDDVKDVERLKKTIDFAYKNMK